MIRFTVSKHKFFWLLPKMVALHNEASYLHVMYRQSREMEEAVKNLGITYIDDQVNQLAQRHFENTQVNTTMKISVSWEICCSISQQYLSTKTHI